MKKTVFRRWGSVRSAFATLVIASTRHTPQLQFPHSMPSARLLVPNAELSIARLSRFLSVVKFCGTPVDRVAHGSEVAGTETVDDPLCCHAKRRDARWIRDGSAARDHHSIEEGVDEDDDEAALRDVITRHVRRHRVDA